MHKDKTIITSNNVLVNSKNPWCWLSSNNIIHAEHPTKNSTTACGIDWDGFNYRPNCNPELFIKCKKCAKQVE